MRHQNSHSHRNLVVRFLANSDHFADNGGLNSSFKALGAILSEGFLLLAVMLHQNSNSHRNWVLKLVGIRNIWQTIALNSAFEAVGDPTTCNSELRILRCISCISGPLPCLTLPYPGSSKNQYMHTLVQCPANWLLL